MIDAFPEESSLCCQACGGSGIGGVEPVCCMMPQRDECCGNPDPSPYPCPECEGHGWIAPTQLNKEPT